MKTETNIAGDSDDWNRQLLILLSHKPNEYPQQNTNRRCELGGILHFMVLCAPHAAIDPVGPQIPNVGRQYGVFATACRHGRVLNSIPRETSERALLKI